MTEVSQRMTFILPLTMGECMKLLRTRKKWSVNKLAHEFNRMNGSPALATCKNIVLEIEANNLDTKMSELVMVSEILGFHLDLHIQKDPPK